uniref:Uncharacterized protein n=1 Tax=Glossina brevipalpis TaxID=37001 RepID=A0A1A9WJG6_9MUSC
MEIFGKFSATLQLISQITRRLTYSFSCRGAPSLERTNQYRSKLEEHSQGLNPNKLRNDGPAILLDSLAENRLKLSDLPADLPTVAIVDIASLGPPGPMNRYFIPLNERKNGRGVRNSIKLIKQEDKALRNETRTINTLGKNTCLIPWSERNFNAMDHFTGGDKDITNLSTKNQLLKLVGLVQPTAENKNVEFTKKTPNALMLYVKPQDKKLTMHVYSSNLEPHGRFYSTRTFVKNSSDSDMVVEGKNKDLDLTPFAVGNRTQMTEKKVAADLFVNELANKDTREHDLPMLQKILDARKDLQLRKAAYKSKEECVGKNLEKSVSKTNALCPKETNYKSEELMESKRKKHIKKHAESHKKKRSSIVTVSKSTLSGKKAIHKTSARSMFASRSRPAILAKDKCPPDPCKEDKTCPDRCVQEYEKVKYNKKVDEHMAKKKRKKMPESCINEKCKRKGGCLPPPKKKADSSGKLVSILANTPPRNSMRVAGVSMKAWPRFNPKSTTKSKNKLKNNFDNFSSPNAMLAIKGKKAGKTKLQFTIFF